MTYADNFFLPFARLAARTFLPPGVLILALKPWTLERERFLGWNVIFMERHLLLLLTFLYHISRMAKLLQDIAWILVFRKTALWLYKKKGPMSRKLSKNHTFSRGKKIYNSYTHKYPQLKSIIIYPQSFCYLWINQFFFVFFCVIHVKNIL